MTHRIEETVNRGMCIGCGACGVATRGAIPIQLTSRRIYQADLDGVSDSDLRIGSQVCPFSDESPNEDVLGAPHGDLSTEFDPKLGQVTSTFAGRVKDDDYLLGSSSGGMTSWLVKRLIDEGHADAVIKVGQPGRTSDELVNYSVVEKLNVTNSRKSHYYATSLVEALAQIEDDNRRFILVGVPCFIRAARALCKIRPEYADKLVFFVGLVCGHFKTQAFAESMAWQVGVTPDDLAEVDFRLKNFDRPSNEYDFGARSKSTGEWKMARAGTLIGGNWGHNSFQPEACNFCDDVVGETADVSFGDAWLPEYATDPRGTNVVISRNPLIDDLLRQGAAEGSLFLEDLPRDDAVKSQAGGFRHRREGLAVRLADDLKQGLSVPKKRVEPDLNIVPARRRKLVRQRRVMAKKSQEYFAAAVEAKDVDVFLSGMHHEIAKYKKLEASLLKRLLRFTRKNVKILLGRGKVKPSL